MTPATEQLFHAALALPDEERSELVEALLAAEDPGGDLPFDPAWRGESRGDRRRDGPATPWAVVWERVRRRVEGRIEGRPEMFPYPYTGMNPERP